MSLLVLSATDVDEIAATFTLDELQYLMAQVFARLSSSSAGLQGLDSGISMPPRISLQTDSHTTLFMPAHIGPLPFAEKASGSSGSSGDQLVKTAIKVVSVPTKDSSKGLPSTTLMLDENTGSVKAVINSRKLTALRNAASSLLSTNLAGPAEPRSIVVFGAGQQIDAHLDLHLRYFASITTCTIINRTLNDRAISLRVKMASRFPHLQINLISSTSHTDDSTQNRNLLEHAVKSADIIICATSSTDPLFPSSWVKNGCHIILIGSYKPTMREIDKALVLRSIPSQIRDKYISKPFPILLVDSREACSHEAGELIDAQVTPSQMTEIGDIIPKNSNNTLSRDSYLDLQPRSSDIEDGYEGPVSIFKSVGIGLQDVVIASAIFEKTHRLGRKFGTLVQNYDI
ncbi:hypothetical protein JR316_0012304 [Psilocybe cubensis]|uniref:Uncharacterized protein n=2 Tax=Psilocybe cubensis TaxID=181762 RepID=A0ACB8GHU8_PSICU|nr:hypothetical protein JR316_0012304 [Psilocybe cubensis]KAH9475193.1 hypothetical protein JR316_0012304 [Psilocybe cubensis]